MGVRHKRATCVRGRRRSTNAARERRNSRIRADPRATARREPTDKQPSRQTDAASARFARWSGSRPAVADVAWDTVGATRDVRRVRDPSQSDEGTLGGRRRPRSFEKRKTTTEAEGRVVRSRREGHEDAPANLPPRLCGFSSSATPCLRGVAPSRPLDRHSVTDRRRSLPPDALSRGAVRWPHPASTRVLTAPRAVRSPPETPPAGLSAKSDDLPSRCASRARLWHGDGGGHASLDRDRGPTGSLASSEATTGLETGTAVRRRRPSAIFLRVTLQRVVEGTQGLTRIY